MRPSSQVKNLERALTAWTPQASRATTWLLPALCDLLDASFVGAYQPVATEHGWGLDFMDGAGPTASVQVEAFRRWVERLPASNQFLAFNPYRVDVTQRNRVIASEDMPRSLLARLHEPLYSAVGLPGHHQMRVLLCEGPRVTCWLGATRSQPFASREAAILQHLAKPVHRRLRLERQLRPSWQSPAAVEAALEALPSPAFVVGPKQRIEVANRGGHALLERDARGVLASIRQSERRPETGAFTVTQLIAPGWPDYILAIAKERKPTASGYAARAQHKWGLTARQTGILELLISGATNKEVAQRSSCAEVTVETHVTELFRRSGARSRTDLVRRVFLLAQL